MLTMQRIWTYATLLILVAGVAISCRRKQDTPKKPTSTAPTTTMSSPESSPLKLWSIPVCFGEQLDVLIVELGKIGVTSVEVISSNPAPDKEFITRSAPLSKVPELVNKAIDPITICCNKVSFRIQGERTPITAERVWYKIEDGKIWSMMLDIRTYDGANSVTQIRRLHDSLDECGHIIREQYRGQPKEIHWKSAGVIIEALLSAGREGGDLAVIIWPAPENFVPEKK